MRLETALGATVISNLLIPSLGLADRPTSLGISRKPCAEFSPRNQRVSTKHTILRQSRAADSGAGDGIRHRHDPTPRRPRPVDQALEPELRKRGLADGRHGRTDSEIAYDLVDQRLTG